MTEFLLDPIFLTLAAVYFLAALLVFALCRAASIGDSDDR
jgi:hypothetical protein